MVEEGAGRPPARRPACAVFHRAQIHTAPDALHVLKASVLPSVSALRRLLRGLPDLGVWDPAQYFDSPAVRSAPQPCVSQPSATTAPSPSQPAAAPVALRARVSGGWLAIGPRPPPTCPDQPSCLLRTVKRPSPHPKTPQPFRVEGLHTNPLVNQVSRAHKKPHNPSVLRSFQHPGGARAHYKHH